MSLRGNARKPLYFPSHVTEAIFYQQHLKMVGSKKCPFCNLTIRTILNRSQDGGIAVMIFGNMIYHATAIYHRFARPTSLKVG